MSSLSDKDEGQLSKASFSIKRVFALLFGIIGIIASTGTVIGMARGWFSPEPSLAEIAAEQREIGKHLQARVEDAQLVSQVSRRVTQLGDQYSRIQERATDVDRLAAVLEKRKSTGKTAILTTGHGKLLAAAMSKERQELLASIAEVEQLAHAFLESIAKDETLAKISSSDSEAGRAKARAMARANTIQNELLPRLSELKSRHEN